MKIITFCLLIGFFFQCTEPKNVNPTFSLDQVKATIHQANQEYAQRFNTNDVNWYKEKYTSDACAMADQHLSVCSPDSIAAYYYDGGKHKGLPLETKETSIYGSAEFVVEEGTWNIPDGKGGSFDHGKFIALWKQEAGKWKLYREIWNSDNPVLTGK